MDTVCTPQKKYIYNKYFNDDLGFGKDKPLAIDLLQKTINILDEFKIEYMLISGTLLGYARHNDFIPWDDDIDLLVDPSLIDKLPDILKKYNNTDDNTTDFSFLNIDNYLVKICFKDSKHIISDKGIAENLINKNDKYTWPFVDLFVFNYRHDKNCLGFFKKTWDIKYFFPVKKITFLNIENVSIPNNHNYFLKYNYGFNYMDRLISSSWNHKNEKDNANYGELTMNEYVIIKSKI